jgi:hypothetical protein
MSKQMFMMKSGQPSVASDDLVQGVDQKICERWHFTISELSCSDLNEIITVRLGYHKFCARCIRKMQMAAQKKRGMV